MKVVKRPGSRNCAIEKYYMKISLNIVFMILFSHTTYVWRCMYGGNPVFGNNSWVSYVVFSTFVHSFDSIMHR